MLLNCDICKKEVDASLIADHNSLDDYLFIETKVSFVECPGCKHPMLAKQLKVETPDGGWDWSNPERIWPEIVSGKKE